MEDCYFTKFSPQNPSAALKDEKYYKYTNVPWCSKCERNSSRRRTRSETLECRRKCREMRSSIATPNPNNIKSIRRFLSHEYENMGEVTYTTTNIGENSTNNRNNRSNLCELPTTYICNNGNKLGVMENLEKSVKAYEQAIKLTENFDHHHHHHDHRIYTSPTKRFDLRQTHIRDISYDTGTLFDNFADSNNLQEKFDREIDIIKRRGKKFPADARKKAAINKRNSKVSLKTRSKTNTIKMKKIKLKLIPSTSTSDVKDSDYSGPDSSESESNSEAIDTICRTTTTTALISDNKSDKSEIIEFNLDGWPLRASQFPFVAPYIDFTIYNAEYPNTLPLGRTLLKWQASTITPPIVKDTLTNTGFIMVKKSEQWIGTWGRHMKSPMFKTLKATQKINHFPGTFQLGRKDRLWDNFHKFCTRFGYKEFGFLPQTYVLPRDLKILKRNWIGKNENPSDMWIVKPPASARGAGVRVINKWSQIPKKLPVVVQKYISNPLLINDSKFDLRLYVLVTSFNPLRIYLYPDGLARFASFKYSDQIKDMSDRYRHLTNYSINKFSKQYAENSDANSCQGHKWTIKKLFEYLKESKSIDTKKLWSNLKDLIIKTVITGEDPIFKLSEENMNSRYNCYELFGVDVLLDDKLKAWLLEVNISPSLNNQSPVDGHVKGPMIKNVFDLALFHLPPRFNNKYPNRSPPCLDPKLYYSELTTKEKFKHLQFESYQMRHQYATDIIRQLNGDDIRQLIKAEDEFVAKGQFERIFPTSQTYRYLEFMEPRYYNRLFDAWENKYEKNRAAGIAILREYCEREEHIKTIPERKLTKDGPITTHPGEAGDQQPQLKQGQNKHTPLVEILQQVTIESK